MAVGSCSRTARWFAFDDSSEGYRCAVEHLGRYAGFVLARVEPERVYRIGGASFRVDPDDT